MPEYLRDVTRELEHYGFNIVFLGKGETNEHPMFRLSKGCGKVRYMTDVELECYANNYIQLQIAKRRRKNGRKVRSKKK